MGRRSTLSIDLFESLDCFIYYHPSPSASRQFPKRFEIGCKGIPFSCLPLRYKTESHLLAPPEPTYGALFVVEHS